MVRTHILRARHGRKLRKLGNNVDAPGFNLTKINSRKYHFVSARWLTRLHCLHTFSRAGANFQQTRFRGKRGPPAAGEFSWRRYSRSILARHVPFQEYSATR